MHKLTSTQAPTHRFQKGANYSCNKLHTHVNTFTCHPRVSWPHPHLCTCSLSTPRDLQQLSPHTHLFTFPLIQLFFPSPTHSLTHSLCHSLTYLLSPLCCIELPVNKPSTLDGCEVDLWWSQCKEINGYQVSNFQTLTVQCSMNMLNLVTTGQKQ